MWLAFNHQPISNVLLMERAAVVIPSYAEGVGPLNALHSIAANRPAGLPVDVCVVVNSAKDASGAVVDSNMVTAGMVTDLMKGRRPRCASGETAAKILFTPDVRLHLLDLFSGDNAPDKCSVGLARMAGTEFVRGLGLGPDDPIVHTDADSALAPDYLVNLRQCFDADPTLDLGIGPVFFDTEFASENEMRGTILYALRWRVRRMWETVVRTFEHPTELVLPKEISGANLVFRSRVIDAVGNFKVLGAGEDAEFVLRAMAGGVRAAFLPRTSVTTSVRFSDRTDAGHGQAVGRMSDFGGPYANYKVDTLEFVQECDRLFRLLDVAKGITGFDAWQRFLLGKGVFSKKQLKKLWPLIETARALPSCAIDPEVNKMISGIVYDKYPRMPLHEALISGTIGFIDRGEVAGVGCAHLSFLATLGAGFDACMRRAIDEGDALGLDQAANSLMIAARAAIESRGILAQMHLMIDDIFQSLSPENPLRGDLSSLKVFMGMWISNHINFEINGKARGEVFVQSTLGESVLASNVAGRNSAIQFFGRGWIFDEKNPESFVSKLSEYKSCGLINSETEKKLICLLNECWRVFNM